LFLNFKQETELLFLDAERDISVDAHKKYHIVLSPSLYWVKREKLPLKYVHEAKKIAATLFEESLPEGEYSYFVTKEDEEFLLFAYSNRDILALLEAKGIALGSVSAVSFAQTACSADEPLRINDKEVMVRRDGVALSLPAAWYEDARALQKSDLQVSGQKITLEAFSHIVDKKLLYQAGFILLLLLLVVGVEYAYYQKELANLREQRAQIFASHHLKPTLMQNRAILQEYKKTAKEQIKLRKKLAGVLEENAKKAKRIKQIVYKDSKIKVDFEGGEILK